MPVPHHGATVRTRRPKRPASVSQAAEYADVGRRTVYNWINTGRRAAWRLGPELMRVDLDDVDRLFVPVATVAAGDAGDGIA